MKEEKDMRKNRIERKIQLMLTIFGILPMVILAATSVISGFSGMSTSPVINFYGEKTYVYMGEDILTKLSIMNPVSNPKMNAQIIILPPSGMSVTSAEFTKTSAGQFAAHYVLEPGDRRDIEINIRSNQAGEFNIKGRVVYYFGEDKDNVQDYGLDLPATIGTRMSTVIPTPSSPITDIPMPISTPVQTKQVTDSETHVYLYGEKTNVVIDEDILLRLSAVNLVNKPVMTVQVILYPPSGMSVTGQDFVKSGAGIYTTTYKLNPSDSKDIEIRIRPNQIGDFSVKGVIVYYFGDDNNSAETITKMLPIKVSDNKDDIKNVKPIPGFEAISVIFLLVLTVLFKNKRWYL